MKNKRAARTLSLFDLADTKRANGVFYTERNPFTLEPFKQWANEIHLAGKTILEPFAGSNNIISMLRDNGFCRNSQSYDITPTNPQVMQHDSIAGFPKNYEVCVTNPPWLARNSATRRGIDFPTDKYDDLYKHCISLCLENCDYVAALIPASFLHSRLFTKRLSVYILLHNHLFDDTENPVCLSLFDKQNSRDTQIYYDDSLIGNLSELKKLTPTEKDKKVLRFNDPDGELGFISFDNTKEPTIRFCQGHEINGYTIKQSSRFITRISGRFGNVRELIKRLNKKVREYRNETQDVFLTPFKGLRSDKKYRRRMDFALARRFINAH